MSLRKLVFGLIGLAVIAGAGFYWLDSVRANNKPPPQAAAQNGPRPQPVRAATVDKLSMPIDITAIGSVQASETVAIKSRIDGEIVKTAFREGDEVKAGDLLFTLDDRGYQSQLRQAEANLNRDKAQLANAKRDVDRLSGLAQKDYVTRQQFDLVHTNAAVLENTIKADEAAIESLRVTLSYTVIKAPISGRTGTINLTKGNIVKANDAVPLVTINQVSPIRVLFAVPQKYFGMVRQAVQTNPIEVFAEIPGSAGHEQIKGVVNFFDNAIDTATGTFQVKAQFANEDRALWPGMFVNVVIRVGIDANALVVPSGAIQSGQVGTYVFVINQDKSVSVRPVTIARDNGDQAVIQKGLSAGEQIVVDGQLRLTNGTKVEIRTAKDSQPPAVAKPAKGS